MNSMIINMFLLMFCFYGIHSSSAIPLSSLDSDERTMNGLEGFLYDDKDASLDDDVLKFLQSNGEDDPLANSYYDQTMFGDVLGDDKSKVSKRVPESEILKIVGSLKQKMLAAQMKNDIYKSLVRKFLSRNG